MAITAEQFSRLGLNAGEWDALGLTVGEYDKMSYNELISLIKIRLDRDIPHSNDKPDVAQQYMETMHSSMAVMNEILVDMRETNSRLEAKLDAQEVQSKKNRRTDLLVGGAIGIVASLIATFVWWKLGPK